MLRTPALFALVAVLPALAFLASAQTDSSWTDGAPQLKSAGPLAFGPDGILFIGDPLSASVFAVDTGDVKNEDEGEIRSVQNIEGELASLLGVKSSDILVNDMVVNPASGKAYLSVSRGRGPDAAIALVTVDAFGELALAPVDRMRHAQAAIPNAPDGKGGKRGEAITDIEFLDGRVFVAGLSNEEFASTLRSIEYPFASEKANVGASIEIYHGAHGAWETRAPVRTLTRYEIEGADHLLAAYTCTPLVKIPIRALTDGKKVMGTTVAELGNRNRPLDMFVYERDGEDFLLIANSSRGVMKVSTAGIGREEGIEERVARGETAGLEYETIEMLEGVEQLDRLNEEYALVLIRTEGGTALEQIELP